MIAYYLIMRIWISKVREWSDLIILLIITKVVFVFILNPLY